MAAGIIKMVFGAPYLAMAVAVTGAMLFGLLLLSEYIFLEPYVVGHIPPGTEVVFALIVGMSAISGLVIPMNIYRILALRRSHTKLGGGLVGSFVGVAAGACSCGPVGLAVASSFGSVGLAASSFLANYDAPIRAAALAAMVVVLYTSYRSLKAECRLR